MMNVLLAILYQLAYIKLAIRHSGNPSSWFYIQHNLFKIFQLSRCDSRRKMAPQKKGLLHVMQIISLWKSFIVPQKTNPYGLRWDLNLVYAPRELEYYWIYGSLPDTYIIILFQNEYGVQWSENNYIFSNKLHRPWQNSLYSKVHGNNMGPSWGRQDPGGFHVGPMNSAIWVLLN